MCIRDSLLTLQEMIYDISSILNSDGQIISATGMPMTGVIRDISIARCPSPLP